MANSEARTYVESRGDVERVTAVVAPNTVLIEETPALQPPLSFQDAPLSYGHEARPSIFFTANLAADSRTHFRPIRDDAEIVDKVVNGEVPPLPLRNHVNRLSANQLQVKNDHQERSNVTKQKPPKPMPRKDVKTKRKRPPPPPPPPRRETVPPVAGVRNLAVTKDRVEDKEVDDNESTEAKKEKIEHESTNHQVKEMGAEEAKIQKDQSSGTSNESEVTERGLGSSVEDNQVDVDMKNVEVKEQILLDTNKDHFISLKEEVKSDICLENNSTSEIIEISQDDTTDEISTCNEETNEAMMTEINLENDENEEGDEFMEIDEKNQSLSLVQEIRNNTRDSVDEEEITDESDGEEYYWQTNLATIGEEEENNSLEYENEWVHFLNSLCISV